MPHAAPPALHAEHAPPKQAAAAPVHSSVRVDWQSVCLDLNVFFNSPGKTSYGQGELQRMLAGSIGRHTVVEGLPVRAVRLYLEDLFANATDDAGGRSIDIPGSQGSSLNRSLGETGEEGVPDECHTLAVGH